MSDFRITFSAVMPSRTQSLSIIFLYHLWWVYKFYPHVCKKAAAAPSISTSYSLVLLCPWDFPGKSTGVGCHCLLWQEEKARVKKSFCLTFVSKLFSRSSLSTVFFFFHWPKLGHISLLKPVLGREKGMAMMGLDEYWFVLRGLEHCCLKKQGSVRKEERGSQQSTHWCCQEPRTLEVWW